MAPTRPRKPKADEAPKHSTPTKTSTPQRRSPIRKQKFGISLAQKMALIDNGSSSIQILPQIRNVASVVTTYIHSPSWISFHVLPITIIDTPVIITTSSTQGLCPLHF